MRSTDTGVSPPIADGVERPLDPRHITLQRLTGWLLSTWVAGATLIVVVIAWLGRGRSLGEMAAIAALWIGANGLLAWHLQRWPAISHRHASYAVDREGIEIRRGVFWRSRINIPRSRVQHTDVSQGPLERRYGLGTLVIHTAGTTSARVSVQGLDHGVALAIREHLLPDEPDDAI